MFCFIRPGINYWEFIWALGSYLSTIYLNSYLGFAWKFILEDKPKHLWKSWFVVSWQYPPVISSPKWKVFLRLLLKWIHAWTIVPWFMSVRNWCRDGEHSRFAGGHFPNLRLNWYFLKTFYFYKLKFPNVKLRTFFDRKKNWLALWNLWNTDICHQ